MILRGVVAIVALLITTEAHAWGSFGHRIVAETAALLVQDDAPLGLGHLLARHRFELGVYAFSPDSTFRHNDHQGGAIEGPLHFLSLDALAGLKLEAPIATVESELVAREANAPVGRVPWRILQLWQLASQQWQRVPEVSGGYQRGANASGPQKAVFEVLYYMGVLAHYSGDIAVRHHATADFNSHSVGQGGLHFFFEGDCVEVFEPSMAPAVLTLARKQRKAWTEAHMKPGMDAVQIALSVLQTSAKAVAMIEQIDKKSAIVTLAEPNSPQFATRKPAAQGCAALRSIVEERLALGAVVTAELWRRAVPTTIDWSKARALQFNDLHSGDFIAFP